MRKMLAITVTAILAACGAGVEGTYKDQLGLTSYTFKSGKVIISTMGVGTEMDYEVEDGMIKVIAPQGTMVMNLLEDGSIAGPMGTKLTKQKD